jgi:hypothetical protein
VVSAWIGMTCASSLRGAHPLRLRTILTAGTGWFRRCAVKACRLSARRTGYLDKRIYFPAILAPPGAVRRESPIAHLRSRLCAGLDELRRPQYRIRWEVARTCTHHDRGNAHTNRSVRWVSQNAHQSTRRNRAAGFSSPDSSPEVIGFVVFSSPDSSPDSLSAGLAQLARIGGVERAIALDCLGPAISSLVPRHFDRPSSFFPGSGAAPQPASAAVQKPMSPMGPMPDAAADEDVPAGAEVELRPILPVCFMNFQKFTPLSTLVGGRIILRAGSQPISAKIIYRIRQTKRELSQFQRYAAAERIADAGFAVPREEREGETGKIDDAVLGRHLVAKIFADAFERRVHDAVQARS